MTDLLTVPVTSLVVMDGWLGFNGTHTSMPTTQLYVSARQHDARDVEERLTDCMEDIGQWMASNRLKLNPAKTDFM